MEGTQAISWDTRGLRWGGFWDRLGDHFSEWTYDTVLLAFTSTHTGKPCLVLADISSY